MLNSQLNPKEDGSTSAINESYSMIDKVAKETPVNVELKDKDSPRKYGLRVFFRHLVCCSCFCAERNNNKYALNSSDSNDAPKSPTNDVNGKKKKVDKRAKNNKNDKSNKTKSLDVNDYDCDGDHEAMCSPLAQNTSASNGSGQCLRELKYDDSDESDNNSKFIKVYSETDKLLPEISVKNQNKKCFIIDLDETLVHSSFKYVKTADINVSVEIDGIQHEVFVCKRPYVDEFLSELGDLFECVLFTASLGKYADPVTNYLDPRGIFEARLFREACAFKEGNYVKDLDTVGRDIDSIVILDNSPVSYLLHPKNALQIVSWFDDPNDTALKDLIPYFKDLAASPLSVSDWLERNRPPETAGILGYPQSNLHWILMQTLSVPEAVSIYKQRLRESYHASGSSNVSRESSTRGGAHFPVTATAAGHDTHLPHHGLITQAINTNRRKSLAAQEDDYNRPPVSSPVARPSSAICLDDADNIGDDEEDDIDDLMESYTDQDGNT